MDIVEEDMMECGSYITEQNAQTGKSGSDGINRGTGGGGSGFAQASGAYGYRDSGGYVTDSDRIHNAYAYGGAGGRGTSYSGGNSGNSVSAKTNINVVNNTVRGTSGSNLGGTGGGLLIIHANSILNNNKISSNGKSLNGNGTGGGSINIFYKEKIIGGTIQAIKGEAGLKGGTGGNGTVTIQEINKLINNP